MLTREVKETMRENAYSLLEILILEEVPFRIAIWNLDNWDRPLPKSIMEDFPTQMLLEISEDALGDSYVDENTGEIIISGMFEKEIYHKTVMYDEIIAILDLDGQPYILNNFYPEHDLSSIKFTTVENVNTFNMDVTKKSIIDMVVAEGVPEESANKSIESFIKHNPYLQGALKIKDIDED